MRQAALGQREAQLRERLRQRAEDAGRGVDEGAVEIEEDGAGPEVVARPVAVGGHPRILADRPRAGTRR